jgi:Major Facilitator Superfamily
MALLVAGMFAMFFLGALYLQRVLEYNPLQVGFAFLPSALVMGALSLEYSEKLIMRFGAKQTLIPAMFCLAAGLLWFSRAPVDGNYWIDVLPATVLIGLGAGTGFPALMGLSMSGAEPQDMGLASGLINATVQVGGAIGLSVLATLAASRTDVLEADGESAMAALNGGFHIAFLIGACLIGGAIIAAATILRSPNEAQMAAMMAEHGPEEQASAEAALSEAA